MPDIKIFTKFSGWGHLHTKLENLTQKSANPRKREQCLLSYRINTTRQLDEVFNPSCSATFDRKEQFELQSGECLETAGLPSMSIRATKLPKNIKCVCVIFQSTKALKSDEKIQEICTTIKRRNIFVV